MFQERKRHGELTTVDVFAFEKYYGDFEVWKKEKFGTSIRLLFDSINCFLGNGHVFLLHVSKTHAKFIGQEHGFYLQKQ